MKKINSNFPIVFFLLNISFFISCQNTSENKSVTVDSTNNTSSTTSLVNKNSTTIQKPDNWVNDNENILDDSSIAQLTRLINNWRDRTAVEIAVVTTATYSPYDSITPYSIALGNHWGIGQNEINNGILIVVSTTQRQVRISPGQGMEQLLPDEKCQQIVNEKMLPLFKQGNYREGIINGVKEIISMLEAQMHTVNLK